MVGHGARAVRRAAGLVARVFACSSSFAAVATAQTPHEPILVVAAYVGVTTGHALWSVGRQPVCQLSGSGGTFNCSPQPSDTMALARSVEPSLAGGLTITYFARRALGLQFDVAYLGLPVSTQCTPVAVSNAQNQQLCSSLLSGPSASAIGFDIGAIVRAPPSANGLSPYVRAGFGLVTRGSSTVEVVGSFAQGGTIYDRTVISDDSPRHTSASLTVGGGLMISLSPGYAFRLEARDVYSSLARVEGPANDLGVAPTGTRSYHHLLVSMGLGIVLEQKRGRRY